MKMPTKADYDRATPFEKGFFWQFFAKSPGSEIPQKIPFAMSTEERDLFNWGVIAALLELQDSNLR